MSTNLHNDVAKLSRKLNLTYYEYDKHRGRFVADNSANPEEVRSELVKLTYTLSKHHISFFKDERSNIVIAAKYNIFTRMKQRIKNILFDFSIRRKSIYLLSDKPVKYAKNLPMIETQTIEGNIDLTMYDALIFSSKNGVKHVDTLSTEWKRIPAYAISAQTAKAIKRAGGKVAFVGKEKHGDDFAHEIVPLLSGKKAAYIGAKTVVSNFIEILRQNDIVCDHIPVYHTVCKMYQAGIKLPKGAIIIFSSPSTIECFFKNTQWDDSYTAISIGKTTAKYFPHFIKPIISENTSLESCVYKALEIQNA